MAGAVKKLKYYLQGYDPAWSSELRANVSTMQDAVAWTFFRAFMILSAPLYAAICGGIIVSLHRPQAILAAKAWAASAIVSLIFATASSLHKKPSRRIMWWGTLSACLVTQLGWVYVAYYSATYQELLRVDRYSFGAIFGNIGIYSALCAFILGFRAIPVVFSHTVLSCIIWFSIDNLDFAFFVLASGVSNVVALIFFVFMRGMVADLIRTYLEAFSLREKNQNLKLQTVQTDMEIARRLHESLMPPPKELKTGRYTLRFFHRPLGELGGDWYAYRELTDGTSVIAVGDVTGKGAGAAMVVQSVQTLWAEALNSPSFSPGGWLQCVHETLQKLGERHVLSLSMGLVILRQQSIDYYSAGHTPLVNICSNAEGLKISQVFGTGHLLGVSSAIREIKPVSLLLNSQTPQVILLGTDGVIGPNLRCSQKALTQFARNFLQSGFEALPPQTDDQILVQIMIEPKAQDINFQRVKL